ncbi:hypothetical protein HK104_010562 [Borealophlyctis nickersoniae]|nr:hypothetical protein HK104_010562 [Borealophlyctis nickersoniae]
MESPVAHTTQNKDSPSERQPLSLMSLNEDVLLAILTNVDLTDFRHLEQTSSYGRKSVLGGLARFPSWSFASDGVIFNAILNGPRPPLYYIDEFISRCAHKPEYLGVAGQLLAKTFAWYPNSKDLKGFVYGHSRERCYHQMFFLGDSDNTAKNMLEDQQFPLGELVRHMKNRVEQGILDDWNWVDRPSIRAVATLSDLRSVESYLLKTCRTAKFLSYVYSKSPPYEQHFFLRRMARLCEKAQYITYRLISEVFPAARAQARESSLILAHDIKHAFATEDLGKLTELVRRVLSGERGRFWVAVDELEHNVRWYLEGTDGQHTEFWCKATGIVQKYADGEMKRLTYNAIVDVLKKPSDVLALCQAIPVQRGFDILDEYLAHWDPSKTAPTRKLMRQLEKRLKQAGLGSGDGKLLGKLKRLWEEDGDAGQPPPKRVTRASLRKSAG